MIEELAPLSEFLRSTYDMVADQSKQPESWKPVLGTEWHKAMGAELNGPSGPWSVKARNLPVTVSSLYINAALTHIANLGVLLAQGAFFLSPELLVRTIIEQATRVSWLLDRKRPFGFAPRGLTWRS